MRRQRLLCVLLLSLLLMPVTQAATARCGTESGHWRDVAYKIPPMDRYQELRGCVAWTAYQFGLPEELLYAVLYVEMGPLNGRCSGNRNGSQDCGPAQINEVRLGELKRFSLDKETMRSMPCHNIWAMGYLLRREIERAGGNIWRGTGNYHFHYSVNPGVHNRYVAKVREAWTRLTQVIAEYCGRGNDAAGESGGSAAADGGASGAAGQDGTDPATQK